jgi:hypothetical protein
MVIGMPDELTRVLLISQKASIDYQRAAYPFGAGSLLYELARGVPRAAPPDQGACPTNLESSHSAVPRSRGLVRSLGSVPYEQA